jgi:hypothetical protein
MFLEYLIGFLQHLIKRINDGLLHGRISCEITSKLVRLESLRLNIDPPPVLSEIDSFNDH